MVPWHLRDQESNVPYTQLSESQLSDLEEKSINPEDPLIRPRSTKTTAALARWVESPSLWMCTTLFFAFISAYMIAEREIFSTPNLSSSTAIGNGDATELVAARLQMGTQIIKFTGGVTFDSEGGEHLRPNPDGMEYIGVPDDAKDQRWRDLEEGRYFLLTEQEAKDSWGSQYRDFYNSYAGGYLATLDVYHLIHCLDHIRQSFYPDRYIHQGVHGELHRDHCIDSLRQFLMCKSDATPIPTRYYPQVDNWFHYIDSDVVHTCRDFDRLRHWTWERVNGSLSVPADGNQQRSGL